MPKNGLAIVGVYPGHYGGQLRTVGDRKDPGYGILHRSCALGVQAHRIEPHLVEVGDLLLDAARRGLDLGHLLKEVVDALLVVLAQHVERTEARVFGFERVLGFCQPPVAYW